MGSDYDPNYRKHREEEKARRQDQLDEADALAENDPRYYRKRLALRCHTDWDGQGVEDVPTMALIEAIEELREDLRISMHSAMGMHAKRRAMR